MNTIKLLLFGRANKIMELDINTGKIKFTDVYSSEEEELEYHTKSFKENKENKFKSTNGFYSIGVNGDYLGFYIDIENNNPKILYQNTTIDFLDGEFKCYQLNEKEGVFECVRPYNFKWVYESFFRGPFDDADEDVNFGLWIMLLYKDKDILARVIKHHSRKL